MSGADKSSIDRVQRIINSFDRGDLSESYTLTQLKELKGHSVEVDWLRNYWRSESLKDFADRLCALPIQDWQALSIQKVESLIAEYINKASPGRRQIIESAIVRPFRKPSGTLSDLVFEKEITAPKLILEELGKDTTIRL